MTKPRILLLPPRQPPKYDLIDGNPPVTRETIARVNAAIKWLENRGK